MNWERKILSRRLEGMNMEDGTWRLQKHSTLIKQVVKVQHLRRLGYIKRMSNQRRAKKMLTTGEGGKKRRGKPNKRLL